MNRPAGAAEVSLELELSQAAGARLWRLPAVAALRAGRPRPARARIAWHDTLDGDLAEAGHALLQVEEAGRELWRLETAARDGSLAWPLGTAAPVLAEAAEPSVLPGSPDPQIPPIATFSGQRRALKLPADSGIAAFALLEGELTVGTVIRPTARLSFGGKAEAVFGLARTLLADLPPDLAVVVPARSLSAEVHALLHGAVVPAAPVLHEALDVDAAFAQVISQLAATIAHHAPGARAATGPEPVHQMRVALRRLRSALSLFGRVAGSPELDQARRELGGLAKALGPARDWDVFLAGTGRAVLRLLPDEPAVKRMNAAARRRRGAAYAELTAVLDQPAFQRTLLDLTELAVVRPWRLDDGQDRPTLVGFAREALDRKLHKVTDAGDDLSPLPPDELHQVRIRCKRLRYAAEFFAPLATGKQSRRFLRRLAAVQERLGQLNDGAVAAELLAELGSRGFAAGIVHGYLAAQAAGGRAKAERSWRKFRRTDPFWV